MNIKSLLLATKATGYSIWQDSTTMNREQWLAFCEQGGELLHWASGPVMDMRVDPHAQNYLFTSSAVPFHWDGAFFQSPWFLCFYCVEAPLANTGGDTFFIDTQSVWQQIPKQQQKRWQDWVFVYQTEKRAHYGGTIEVPLVQKHPITNHTILRFAEPVNDHYLNPVSVVLKGATQQQSQQAIEELRQAFVELGEPYTHHWQSGDIVIADNHRLVHGRHAFDKISPRHLRRIQILNSPIKNQYNTQETNACGNIP